jgi:ubiquinone/menaquinone biosynthesis C-methylase UbiE
VVNTVQIIEAYWKEHPAWFGRTYGEYLHLGANQEMLRLILKGVTMSKETRVLDVSCALGGNARWLASIYGSTVDGVDSFKPAIVTARQLAKAQGVSDLCRFVVGTAEALPFPDKTFDLAVTAEGDSSWEQIHRVLKPGGIIAGSTVAMGGLGALESALRDAGLAMEHMIDATAYALGFYKAKEEEAKLLVAGGLMKEDDLRSLQMYTVDLYEAGSADHALFRARRT